MVLLFQSLFLPAGPKHGIVMPFFLFFFNLLRRKRKINKLFNIVKRRTKFQEAKFNYQVSCGVFFSAAKDNGIDNAWVEYVDCAIILGITKVQYHKDPRS